MNYKDIECKVISHSDKLCSTTLIALGALLEDKLGLDINLSALDGFTHPSIRYYTHAHTSVSKYWTKYDTARDTLTLKVMSIKVNGIVALLYRVDTDHGEEDYYLKYQILDADLLLEYVCTLSKAYPQIIEGSPWLAEGNKGRMKRWIRHGPPALGVYTELPWLNDYLGETILYGCPLHTIEG